MRITLSLLLTIGIASAQTSLGADFSKVDRTLIKEPAYHSSSPRYCMLVFGPEAKTRAWVILDGDSLYLDRNGNGDLTEEGEHLRVRLINKELDSKLISEGYHFVGLADPSKENFLSEDRDVPTLRGTTRYTRFSLDYFVRDEAFVPKTPQDLKELKSFETYWEGFVDMYVAVDRKFSQRGRARFASKPSEAPIIHFDGPMTFEFYDVDPELKLVRGEDIDLRVRISTRGIGKGAVTWLRYDSVPKSVNPVAEIEYSRPEPGGTLRTKSVLDQRAGGEIFHGLIHVPEEAVAGKAKLKLSLIKTFIGLQEIDDALTTFDLRDAEVAPVTFHVPVVDRSPARD